MYKINKYQACHFFHPDFPFAIRHVFNLAKDFNLSKRFQREFWKITYIVTGSGYLVIDNDSYHIQPKSILLVHPQAITTWNIANEELELYNIVFNPVILNDILDKVSDVSHYFDIFNPEFQQNRLAYRYLLNMSHEMKILIMSMFHEYESALPNRNLLLKLKLAELLILLSRMGENKLRNNPDQVYAFIRNMIATRYTEPLSVKEIAKSIGVTVPHLSRLYKLRSGVTLTSDLKDRRLTYAAELLSKGKLDILEICFKAGFNDLSYFYRSFSAKFGTSPGKFRKKILGKFELEA
jgi:AraC-like DNA-binding protein